MQVSRSLLAILATTAAQRALGQFCEHQWEGPFAADGLHARQTKLPPPPPLEVRPLVVNGPSENRNNLMYFSDGYTENEKEKFFADALRLTKNLTEGQTFADVLPVMNWWAAFTPSKQSGVGTHGKPLDTVYGLYRQGTELRGVYYTRADLTRAACSSTGACDYPILLGNDPYYGGLGGSITVVTASFHNGPAVLRHELGHSIIDVGEEYEGGTSYFGVNSGKTPDSVPWKQWLNEPTSKPRAERSNVPIQSYPWTLLNATRGWTQTFRSAGTYASYELLFSLSGVTRSSDVAVAIDGKDVGWQVNPLVGVDRFIYEIKFNQSLAPGTHSVSVTLKNSALEGKAQLCNIQIIEYGNAKEFAFTPQFHGAYPTFSSSNVTTYRPTNDMCLMRKMYSVDFCHACIEGMWWSLLGDLTLIENVTQSTGGAGGATEVTLEVLPLAQFRKVPNNHAEAFTILWFDEKGAALDQWTNSTTATLSPGAQAFEIEVRFWSEQIRKDPRKVTVQREKYTVG